MSSESSSSSSEGSTSESSSKSVSSESKSIRSGGDPIESRNRPRLKGGSKYSLPPGMIQGYNSKDYHRDNLEFSRFAVNRIRKNRINSTRLSAFGKEFLIPPEVRLRIPNVGEQVSNHEPGCVAIHSAFLEIEMCLPLQPYVRRFFRERILIGMWCLWRLRGIDTDPTLSEIKHCYKLVCHAPDGDGWWHLSSWTRLACHSLITGLPSSNKEWKKTWFDLTVEERDYINTAWGTQSDHLHIDHLLNVRVLASVNIIPEPSSLRLANSKMNFGKKRKLAGKSNKKKMYDKEVAPSRRGNLGAKIHEELIKEVSSKYARTTTETSDPVLPEQEVHGGADPLRAMPPIPSRGGKSKAGSTESVKGGDKRPGVSQSSVDAIFSPDQSVDFICDNARNFLRSTDPGATGKMKIMLVELHHQLEHTEVELIHKKDMLSCIQRDLGESREEVARLKARVASLEEKAAKGAKAEEYRGRLKDARRLITRLQNELPNRTIDHFVKSSEYMKAINDEFQQGSLNTQYLVSKVDLNFDFEKFEEIKAAEWGTGEAAKKADTPEEEEDSLLVVDVELFREEVEEVGSGEVGLVGLPDHFDWRLVPWDFLIILIRGWSQSNDFLVDHRLPSLLDHFVCGFYQSVDYQCQNNFFDLRVSSLWGFDNIDGSAKYDFNSLKAFSNSGGLEATSSFCITYDPIEEVATNDYQWSYERATPESSIGTPLGCFLCGGPHMSIDCQVDNPFADGSYEQINYNNLTKATSHCIAPAMIWYVNSVNHTYWS
ncbi:hypothetical protein ACOSP7_007783 [Xanthoceras sorbifolium]